MLTFLSAEVLFNNCKIRLFYYSSIAMLAASLVMCQVKLLIV